MSCLVAISQPSQSAGNLLCFQEGRSCFLHELYHRVGFQGSVIRSTCQVAKPHFLVLSMATALAHHPSMCASQRCPGTHAKTPTDLPSSFLLYLQTVTSKEPHLPLMSHPGMGLTLKGSAACPKFPSLWGPTTSPWRMAN